VAPPSDPTSAPAGVTREQAGASTDDAVGVSLPVGFRATSDDEGFKLVVKKRSKTALFFVPFALFWNGFMVVWFTIAFAGGLWGMAAAGTLHALIGGVMAYVASRGVLNRIELTITRGVLSVDHKPLPWFRPPPIERRDIEQLFVEEDRSLRVNNRPVVRFALKLREKGGKVRQLFILDEIEQARFLEGEVERAFGIEDEPVPGEA
jgi:hypothetical protein